MNANENFYPNRFEYKFDVHMRHYERYITAIQVLGKIGQKETWLDCACGSGYGTHLLSGFVKKIIGFDINKDAVAYAKKQYGHSGCIFHEDRDSLSTMLFDAIISIETIEHMPRTEAVSFLNFFHKLMNPAACLVITTPIVPVSNPDPTNTFHEYEYSYDEFMEILSDAGFTVDYYTDKVVTFTDGETKKQAYFRCLLA